MRRRPKSVRCSPARRPCWPPAHACSARRATRPSAPAEIGKGAGIAGPGLYRTFSSKQAILDALIRRLDEWWSLETIRALRADQACRMPARTSSGAGSGSAWTTPTSCPCRSPNCRTPPARSTTATRETRPTAKAVWIDLICKLVPETTVAQARLLVAAAISFIDDAVRTWHLTRYAGVADEITAIALSILTSRKSPQR